MGPKSDSNADQGHTDQELAEVRKLIEAISSSPSQLDATSNGNTAESIQTTEENTQLNTELPANSIIAEVNHLAFDRTLYFSLTPDATIEPLVTWLRISFNDSAVSGMVLQYKGTDGLWKCLLNRDDSLKRVLKQNMKTNSIISLRVPREQDLLSSGYTDKRLLALTKPGAVV